MTSLSHNKGVVDYRMKAKLPRADRGAQKKLPIHPVTICRKLESFSMNFIAVLPRASVFLLRIFPQYIEIECSGWEAYNLRFVVFLVKFRQKTTWDFTIKFHQNHENRICVV